MKHWGVFLIIWLYYFLQWFYVDIVESGKQDTSIRGVRPERKFFVNKVSIVYFFPDMTVSWIISVRSTMVYKRYHFFMLGSK